MSSYKYIKYQDLYREAWEKQNEIDRKLRPSLLENPKVANGMMGLARNHETGNYGGRPKRRMISARD